MCCKLFFSALNYTHSNLFMEVAEPGENMKRIFFTAAMLCGGAQASSNMFTGQELYTRLTSDRVMALGYIAGVADSQSGITICMPPGKVTLGQMADMVKQSLENVPSERHLSADIYVQVTLSNRWPCAKKEKGQSL